MTFQNAQYLILLAALPVAVAIIALSIRRRTDSMRRIGDHDLVTRLARTANTRGRMVRRVLILAALGLAVVALARPQWGESSQIVERRGIQLIVALDISKSMLAEDLKPNRLERAKFVISDLIGHLTGDEFGLVIFSGSAFVQFPLTFDYATARTFLATSSPRMIATQGTAIARAIEVSMGGFDSKRLSQKVIVIVSDGENHEEGALEAAHKAAEEGAVIFTVGVGTSEGHTIPDVDPFGEVRGPLTDRQGNLVVSRMNEMVLRQIAVEGGGKFYAESASTAELLAQELNTLQEAASDAELQSRKVERFQIFAVVAILLLIAAELVSERRSIAPPVRARGQEA